MLLPEYPAKITTGQCSLFWWSPVELGDVRFEDTEGQPLLIIEKITSEKTLIALLADRVRVGGFQILRPHFTIQVREGGSNLEEAIAPFFASSEDSQGLDAAFHVREGIVEIEDAQNSRQTELRNFEADVRLPIDSAEAITVRGAAQVQNAGANGKAGALDFDVSYRSLAEANSTTPQNTAMLRLKTSDLRLNALSALLGRCGSRSEIAGVLVSDLAAEWTSGDASPTFKLHGGLSATGIGLSAPAWLGTDKFQLEYLTQKGRLEYHAGEVHLTDWNLKSDVLSCEANGVLNVPRLLAAWKTPSAEIPVEEFHLTGEVNVARLAKMFPETLKLRAGLEVQSGKVNVALDADVQNAEHVLSGKISASRIAAVADGREIAWDKPLELSIKARNTHAGPVLDEFTCRADFLSLSAQGTPDNATFKAACKLEQLMMGLNRFADLKPWQLAGRIDAGLTLRRLSPELIRGAASAIIKNFQFAQSSNNAAPAWEETQLVLAAGGDLVSQANQPNQLQNLSLKITSGGDQLQVSQTEPILWTGTWPDLALNAELRGELSSWQNRLHPLVSMDGLQMQGNVIATAQAKLSPARMTLQKAIADFQGLQLQTAGIHLNESRVHVETKADWTAEANKLRLPVTTWTSPSLSLRADDVEYFTTPQGRPRTSGQVVFRGGVSELSRWFSLEQTLGPNLALAGIASGQMDLMMTDQSADANWNILVEKAALSRLSQIQPPPGAGFAAAQNSPRETVWAEDRLAFRGGGVYDFSQDHLQLRPTLLESPWLYVTLDGTLADAGTRGNANLTGTLTCNLPVLAERYRNRLGQNFQIAGNDSRPFSVRGPIWGAAANQRVANELTAFAGVPWQSMNAYGIPVGPGELKADLNLGTVQFGPLDAVLGTGRMKLNSRLALNAPELALQIEKGPLLDNIRITPEISRDYLKFAVPLLGNSTETAGQFSAFLTTEGIIPLANPTAMNASGILAIESVQMRPGPLANRLLEVVKQVKTLVQGQAVGGVLPANQTLIRLDKQNINVQAANGRIYHQQLKMVLTDIPITTSGSVGFDETLSLTAEIPIQPGWLAQNRLLANLKGQTLKIPIGGTFSQPVLDTRAIFAILQNAAQNATGQVIENELQNQFQRLFKKR